MSNKVELPQLLSILSPRPSGVLPRGRNALKGADPQRSFRCPDDKWVAIAEAAEVLGMSSPEFCRWVSYAAANEVLRIAREQKVAPPIAKVEVVNTPTIDVPVRKIVNPYK